MRSFLNRGQWAAAISIVACLLVLFFSGIRIHSDFSLARTKEVPMAYRHVIERFFLTAVDDSGKEYRALFPDEINDSQAEVSRLQVKALLGDAEVASITPYAYEEKVDQGKIWVLTGYNVLLADERKFSGQFTFLKDEPSTKIQSMNLDRQWFNEDSLKTSFHGQKTSSVTIISLVVLVFFILAAAIVLLIKEKPKFYPLWLLLILGIGYGQFDGQLSSGDLVFFDSTYTASLPLAVYHGEGAFIFSVPLGAVAYLCVRQFLKYRTQRVPDLP